MKTLTRILMVEDEPDIQTVARIALEVVGGYTVEMCGSGPEALRMIRSVNPDLVLMDVMMPGMDGPTTLKHLRSAPETAHFPVVFMTAKIQSHEIQKYRGIGALGVIPKPFDPMTLATSVNALWEEAHAVHGCGSSEAPRA